MNAYELNRIVDDVVGKLSRNLSIEGKNFQVFYPGNTLALTDEAKRLRDEVKRLQDSESALRLALTQLQAEVRPLRESVEFLKQRAEQAESLAMQRYTRWKQRLLCERWKIHEG